MESRYSRYSAEQVEELLSNYLVDSWSYSGVSCFSRNEKAFEMEYVYRERGQRGATSVAGSAYHKALENYFSRWGKGDSPDLLGLTSDAFAFIDAVPDCEWRLTAKLPTVEEARAEASKSASALLENFCREIGPYMEGVEEVLGVEHRYEGWVVVNGVEVPLPLHAVMDLVLRMEDGSVVVADHKSKTAYTDPAAVSLVYGQQAATYAVAWEAETGEKVSQVWLLENKVTRNRDGSPQLRRSSIPMDPDSRALYESLLYEPLKRMVDAVSDPDYVYTVNPSDKLSDPAVLYDFWARTQIAEVEDFVDVPEAKREAIGRRLRKIRDSSVQMVSPQVISDFRRSAASFIIMDYTHSDMTNSEKIEHLLRTYQLQVHVERVVEGYSCDAYLCQLASGVEVRRIMAHSLDLALALDVPAVRIPSSMEIYEGRAYLCIEVPKVRTEDLVWVPSVQGRSRVLNVGLDNFRRPVVWDLGNQSTPHMLVCGASGSGKSVFLYTLIRAAVESGVGDIVVCDPKYEFVDRDCGPATVYSDIPDVESYLASLVVEMNERIRARRRSTTLVVFDEFADAADCARTAKQLQPGERTLMENLKLLLQKGRSCGIRIALATQRASVKTIPGDLKVNLPVQVCFRVPKAADSRVVIDEDGAQGLAGAGDGLMRSPQYNDRVVRFQAYYVPDEGRED